MTVDQINRLEPELEKLSDEEVRAKSDALKEKAQSGTRSEISPSRSFRSCS